MSRLFNRSRSSSGSTPQQTQHHDDHNPYLSLLEPDHDYDSDVDMPAQATPILRRPSHRRNKSVPHEGTASRSWLAVVENRSSGTGERPPTRKLVKEQNGSGRPSFSLELTGNNNEEKEKGLVRRQIARLKGLYQRTEKAPTA